MTGLILSIYSQYQRDLEEVCRATEGEDGDELSDEDSTSAAASQHRATSLAFPPFPCPSLLLN